METTIMGYIRVVLGLYWGYIGIMEKKDGNHYLIFGYIWDHIGL